MKYRIDKLIENGIIVRFHTVINYFKLGIAKYKLYLRLTNADKEKLNDIAHYFFSHKKTEWVALTTGRWDLISGFLVNNVNEFDDEVQDVLNKFSDCIQEKAVTATLYLAHSTRGFLKNEKNREITANVYHTTKDRQERIDETDLEILKVIANNARMTVIDIAKKINSTPRIVQYRLKELEKKKIILAFRVHLEPRAMDRIFCKAIIYLANVTESRLKSFIGYASYLPGAIWPQKVMGSWDFEIDFELENYDQFQGIILELKEKFPDIIRSHDFCIVSKEFKLDLFPGCCREIKQH